MASIERVSLPLTDSGVRIESCCILSINSLPLKCLISTALDKSV